MICRCCGSTTNYVFLKLSSSPVANSFRSSCELELPEHYYPLNVYICQNCFLVQVPVCKDADQIFDSEYIYFSSISKTFVAHAEKYVNEITETLNLGSDSLVVEAASNDGYLLQFFDKKSIPCVGVEPSLSTAKVAIGKGIETIEKFFGVATAKEIVSAKGNADLFVGNNVIAHVPDLTDFIQGIETLLKPSGTATVEFPHLLNLVEQRQFDTVYHEHFSYFSLTSNSKTFETNGMYVYKVEELDVHGGSLRVFSAKKGAGISIDNSIAITLQAENDAGLNNLETYKGFQSSVDALCLDFIEFLVREKKAGAKIAAYGAAAKGNTLLNYCGVKSNMIDFVADLTPLKQGKFLPGSHIPVFGEEKIVEERPDYIVILPWNWEGEIRKRLSITAEWGAKLVTVIPSLKITDAQ